MAEFSPATSARGTAFAVRSVWTPPRVFVYLTGELDAGGTEILARCVQRVVTAQPPAQQVTVDLHDLSFVDLVGVRALCDAWSRLGAASRVEIRGVTPSVQRTLDVIEGVFPDWRRRIFADTA